MKHTPTPKTSVKKKATQSYLYTTVYDIGDPTEDSLPSIAHAIIEAEDEESALEVGFDIVEEALSKKHPKEVVYFHNDKAVLCSGIKKGYVDVN